VRVAAERLEERASPRETERRQSEDVRIDQDARLVELEPLLGARPAIGDPAARRVGFDPRRRVLTGDRASPHEPFDRKSPRRNVEVDAIAVPACTHGPKTARPSQGALDVRVRDLDPPRERSIAVGHERVAQGEGIVTRAIHEVSLEPGRRETKAIALDAGAPEPKPIGPALDAGRGGIAPDDPAFLEELGGDPRHPDAEEVQPNEIDEEHRAVVEQHVDVPLLERDRKTRRAQ
jgi:hypothetical protein